MDRHSRTLDVRLVPLVVRAPPGKGAFGDSHSCQATRVSAARGPQPLPFFLRFVSLFRYDRVGKVVLVYIIGTAFVVSLRS